MRIVSIMNQKGGCGKTTTAINLSAFLAEFGKKVLLIDLDPQGHSSSGLNIQENMIELGMFDVFTKQASMADIIKLQVCPGLDLAPTTVRLSAVEQYLSGTFERERQLRYHIEQLSPPFVYDFIIIDCPPHLGLLVFNALMASQEVIVPIEPSSFSLQGIDKLLETVTLLKENAHHMLKVMALPTLYNHHNHFSREILKQIQEKFGEMTLKTVIRQNVKLKEAAQKGLPIGKYGPESFGAEDYQKLAFELIQQEEPEFMGAEKESPETQKRGISPGATVARKDNVIVIAQPEPAPDQGTKEEKAPDWADTSSMNNIP